MSVRFNSKEIGTNENWFAGSFSARRKDSLVDVYYDQLSVGVYGLDSLIGTSMVSIPVSPPG